MDGSYGDDGEQLKRCSGELIRRFVVREWVEEDASWAFDVDFIGTIVDRDGEVAAMIFGGD